MTHRITTLATINIKLVFSFCLLFICGDCNSIDTYIDTKFSLVSKQENYYSCGCSIAQALITLQTGEVIPQSALMSYIISKSGIIQRKGGISLLDLRNILNLYGVTSTGFISKDKNVSSLIKTFDLPIVLHYKNQNATLIDGSYIDAGHFVLLYYFDNNYFFIADPLLGNRIVTEEFLKENMSGYGLAVKITDFHIKLTPIVTREQNRLSNIFFVKKD